MIKILVVDDEEHIRFILKELLTKNNYQTKTASTGKKALSKIRKNPPHLVLLDYKLPDMNGNEILEETKNINPNIVVIMLTAYGDVKIAVKAMKLGAFDYITKPFNNEEIILVIKKAIEKLKLENKVKQLENKLSNQLSKSQLVGDSKAIQRVLKQVEMVSQNDISVYLEGETGTGKDFIANMIHTSSPRANKPFVAVDCGAIPQTLFESEMFGYRKGAFTGAKSNHTGKIEQANNGTLFLDEIGNLPLEMQAKFLRVLEEKKVSSIGSKKVIPVNIRIISATNQDIVRKIRNNRFRDDLFYRICEFKIKLPPLRDRKSDIPILCNHFLKQINEDYHKQVKNIAPAAYDKLIDYSWPGNVRELKNVIKRAVLLTNNTTIKTDNITFNLPEYNVNTPPQKLEEISNQALRKKRKLIEQTIKEFNGNKSKAAEKLKISRKKLYKILNYELK